MTNLKSMKDLKQLLTPIEEATTRISSEKKTQLVISFPCYRACQT